MQPMGGPTVVVVKQQLPHKLPTCMKCGGVGCNKCNCFAPARIEKLIAGAKMCPSRRRWLASIRFGNLCLIYVTLFLPSCACAALSLLFVESLEVVWLDSVVSERVDLGDGAFVDELAVPDEFALLPLEFGPFLVGV